MAAALGIGRTRRCGHRTKSFPRVPSGQSTPTPAAPIELGANTSPRAVFRLPFTTAPGPDTWLLLQPYGNTVFAYQYRSAIYHAGQGLHFGVDFAARCGTEVVAIGDGIVSSADNPYHGAGPHNLMINHPNGMASFYGHLLSAPFVHAGEEVVAGQLVGLTGDPDLTCTSRPHLHLEIRGRASPPQGIRSSADDRSGLESHRPGGWAPDLLRTGPGGPASLAIRRGAARDHLRSAVAECL